ncbi:hypothetical protein ACI8AK_01370 [Geodermatophilus sp. SYSU D00867]
MSVRTRSVVSVVGALAAGIVLVPSAALADPPALDDRSPSCAAVLARAVAFPGTVPTPSGTQRVVSDAYVSHLLRSEECAPAGD